MWSGAEELTIRRTLRRGLVASAALVLVACSVLRRNSPIAGSAGAQTSAPPASAEATPEAAPGEGNPSAPGATVNISYAHADDYLTLLGVSEFEGAAMLETRNLDATHTVSIVRFDGGVPVWEIKADTGVLSNLPGLSLRKKYAVKSVTYGKLPEHFTQALPDSGPPAPLEPGHYYVFTARRASGIVSYEAIRVEADGTLDGYEAEPRAGTSYALCCDVSPDFAQPAASVPGP
jgi:hypothetical protein